MGISSVYIIYMYNVGAYREDFPNNTGAYSFFLLSFLLSFVFPFGLSCVT